MKAKVGLQVLQKALLVDDGSETSALPDWAVSLLHLGWLLREETSGRRKRLVILVLPCRALAAAFAALGAVLAGAHCFTGGISWRQLRECPLGTKLYWRTKDGSRLEGSIVSAEDDGDWVKVRVDGGKKNWIGASWQFTEPLLQDCLFSQVRLPSSNRERVNEEVARLHSTLGLKTNPTWFVAGAPEVSVVTNRADFLRGIEQIGVSAQRSQSTELINALHTGTPHANKVRLVSSDADLGPISPVVILDGLRAFRRIPEIPSCNVAVLLDRTEIGPEVTNRLFEFGQFSKTDDARLEIELPPTFEMAAFSVTAEQ